MKYFTITPETTPETLKAEYLALAKIHHPDKGGSKEDFQQLEAEYQQAKEMLSQRPVNGYVTETEAFKNIMGAADDLCKRFLGTNVAEISSKGFIKIIDFVKIAGLEDIKPILKMNVEEKLSNPLKFANEIEKFLRSNKNLNKK